MTAYASLVQLKSYLEIAESNTDDDELLTMFLDNASAIIDTQTHRTFVSSADETHYHDAIKNVEGNMLWLNGDLAALTSVTNGDGADIPLDAIVTNPDFTGPYFALTLKRSKDYSWAYTDEPAGAIGVEGRWAYSIVPPLPIVQATLRLAAWLYRQRDNANDLDRTMIVGVATILPAQIPTDVAVMLKPFLKRTAP